MEGNENPKRECEVLESVLISLIPALPAISRRGFTIIVTQRILYVMLKNVSQHSKYVNRVRHPFWILHLDE